MPKSLINLNSYLGLVDPKQPVPLTHLKVKDRQILMYHLQGVSPKEIVEQLETTTARIRRVLNSDLGQQVIEDYFKFSDLEFEALYSLSISAIRDALNSVDIDIRLKAADKFLKAHGKYDKGSGVSASAEDVIRRVLELKITEERPANARQERELKVVNIDRGVSKGLEAKEEKEED